MNIEINGEKTITVPAGESCYKRCQCWVFLPSACGGGGSCAQCKCVVSEGGGSMLPTEEAHLLAEKRNEGWRFLVRLLLSKT